MVPYSEEMCTVCEPGFGLDVEIKSYIFQSLYGHKFPGSYFISHMDYCIILLGLK